MKKILLTICLLFLSLASADAQLRRCDYGLAPCEAYANADAVFIGEVTKIIRATTRIWQTEDDYDQTAYVTVHKVYKGSKRTKIVLRQLGRRHTQKFIAGSRYLFFANYDRTAKIWEVRPCGRTVMAQYAQDDLRYLDALPMSAKRTRVAGRVMRVDIDEENTHSMTDRLAGIKLKIIGQGGQYDAVTDANGIYELYDLPPGYYTVQPKIPNGLVFLWAIHYGSSVYERAKSLEIELKEGGCSGVEILLTTDKSLKKDAAPGIGKV